MTVEIVCEIFVLVCDSDVKCRKKVEHSVLSTFGSRDRLTLSVLQRKSLKTAKFKPQTTAKLRKGRRSVVIYRMMILK